MNTLRLIIAALLFTHLCAPYTSAQLRGPGSQPVEPFQVIDSIYYVGAVAISAHIITTSEGLILIDTGSKEMLPGLQANIEKLGHKVTDIKIILSSHAHWDHVEGHARMKELTGAKVMAVGEDATAIASGIDNSALGADGWTPVEVDRVLKDGDTVTLGEVTLTAHLTAGHTKGCTTWTMSATEGGRSYNVVFIGGTSVNGGVNLLGNTRHPSIAEDYAHTFKVLKELKGDVFLAQHPFMYNMRDKIIRMNSGEEPNPFIDPEGYKKFVIDQEGLYLKQLAKEKAEKLDQH